MIEPVLLFSHRLSCHTYAHRTGASAMKTKTPGRNSKPTQSGRHSWKHQIWCFLIPALMAVFIMIPSRASSIRIRIHFAAVGGDSCALFYSTDTHNTFSSEQALFSAIDPQTLQAEFTLDPSCKNHITGLRLDFPDTEQLLCIKSITVSSAGVVKRQYNPCDFFTADNLACVNDIATINLAAAQARAYLYTLESDPYVILSDELCRQIAGCYSHFRLTKLAVCLFILGCCFLARKNIFKEDPAVSF